jgi:glutathione synthase/RimK-type ligase-like ATP-grasp enzyme
VTRGVFRTGRSHGLCGGPLAAAHQEVIAIDIGETDRGVVVIELNGIVASGGYELNSFPKLPIDLQAVEKKRAARDRP